MKNYKKDVLSIKISEINSESRFSLSSKDYAKFQIVTQNTKKLDDLLVVKPKFGREIGSDFYMKKSSYRFLKTVNISDGYFLDLGTVEYCKPGNTVFPKKNDILIVKDGAGKGIGEVALYPYENKDNRDSISSGLIAIRVDDNIQKYILAVLKSQHFKDFVDLNTAQGSTIRHSKKISLEYEVPFPSKNNNINPKKVETLISVIVENILDKEKQIKVKQNKIDQLIKEELLNNQGSDTYTYSYPRITEIKKSKRLDTGIYEEEFNKLDFLISNYKNGFFKISEDKFSSGSTPRVRVFNPKNENYKWVTPTLISDEGFYNPSQAINMKGKNNIAEDSILIINRTSRGKKGEYVGISCFYDFDKYGTGHHNQGLYRITEYSKEEKLFIVSLLNSELYRKICGCISIGSKMKEMKLADFAELKFLNFPENVRKKIIKEYYKESNLKDKEIVTMTNYAEISKLRNSELGIFQNSFELVHLRKQLEDIIDKIINDQEIDVASYL